LRKGDPPLVGRIEAGRIVLDLRSVLEDEWGVIPDLVLRAAEAHAGTERPAAGDWDG